MNPKKSPVSERKRGLRVSGSTSSLFERGGVIKGVV